MRVFANVRFILILLTEYTERWPYIDDPYIDPDIYHARAKGQSPIMFYYKNLKRQKIANYQNFHHIKNENMNPWVNMSD